MVDRYSLEVGGNGNCASKGAANGGVYDLPEGYKIAIEICLINSGLGHRTYCDELDTMNVN